MASTAPVWLITGCSSGFGAEITRTALSRGYRVIATSRTPSALSDLAALGATPLPLDVRSSDAEVQKAVSAAHAVHGRLDVLVNNAGYILEGAVEQCSSKEVQDVYEVNVFGALRVARAVLPYFREQRAGTVCMMGSIGGWRGTPFGGLYCSTKWALAGVTQSLKTEVEEFGIEVVCVEPGYFRTNFLTTNNRISAAADIADYRDKIGAARSRFDNVSKHQPGDPVKGASLIVDLVTKSGAWKGVEHLPWRVPLGKDAAQFIREVIQQRSEEHETWAGVTSGTNCDDVAA